MGSVNHFVCTYIFPFKHKLANDPRFDIQRGFSYLHYILAKNGGLNASSWLIYIKIINKYARFGKNFL